MANMLEKPKMDTDPGRLRDTYFEGQEASSIDRIFSAVRATYEGQENIKITEIDGISVEYHDPKNPANDWRFNVRGSNTEPKLRFNAEGKSSEAMLSITLEVLNMITGIADQMGLSGVVEGINDTKLRMKKAA